MTKEVNYKWVKFRILLTSTGFILFLGALLLRSYHLHIEENNRVKKLATNQYQALLPVAAKRGAIYDRNGKELAMDVRVASVAVHPQQIKDKEAASKMIAEMIEMPLAKVQEKLNSTKKFEWLARRIPFENGEKLQKQKITGVVVSAEYKRFYPGKELAGHLLGAVGFDAKALSGLEIALDSYLKSVPSSQVAEKDAKGRLITPLLNTEVYHDVYLTIDQNIQFMAEKYLRENGEKYHAKSGFALVTDPHTGEILAMANYPSFNPNSYSDYPQESWKNHAIIDSYEPGSTFKAVVAASALNTGTVKSTDKFDCEGGAYKIGKHTIHDHGGHGIMTVSDIIKVSSNIGVTKIAQKIGKDAFYETISGLGFGRKVGIGLPGEEQGILRNPKNWSAIDQSNIAFGQGLTVTGLQMAMAYSTFANGGNKMKPLLVSRIINSEGQEIVAHDPELERSVINKDASKSLTHMLESVVEEGGTGTLASLDGYPIAGKTGTAQKVDPKTKKYAPGKFVSSFIGYVPATSPEFVIYVVYDTPQPLYYGGVVATPVFKNIAKEALAYKGVPAPQSEVLASAAQGN